MNPQIYSNSAPAIGGPFHGQLFVADCKSHFRHRMAVSEQTIHPAYTDAFREFNPGRDIATRMAAEESELSEVRLSFGAVMLSGWVWKWCRIKDELLPGLCIGLLIGQAMKGAGDE